MKESYYNFLYEFEPEENSVLIYNSRTNALAVMEAEHTQMFNAFVHDKSEITDEAFLKSLVDEGFVVEDDVNELSIIKYQLLSSRFNTKVLALTIAVTSDCNFRCIYCYEKSNMKAGSKMTDETKENLLKFVEEQLDTIEQLSINWYGGEPLLVMDSIEDMSNRLIRLCEEKGVTYTAGIVTNGYLFSTETAKRLAACKVTNMQITIDGPEEIHNKRRPLAGGQGTFKKILENVKDCKGLIDHICIRINTDQENVNETNKLIRDIKEMGVDSESVSFYLGLVESHNGCYLDEKCLTAEAFSHKHLEFMKENGIHLMNAYPELVANFCGADLRNSFVVDPAGLLYKCWNDVGIAERAVGSIAPQDAEDTRRYNDSLYYDYMLYDATEDAECRDCKFLPICMGGCPFKRRENGNRCVDKKYIMEEYLKECATALMGTESQFP
ncbi:MAG: SPASM domain-containing protein [Lachnospiraceae bacterium]|jgi:radical SAM additional 4Fe4S-binding domain|nr:SPASM domain-containing protein [Lachnospiraceae bacterium]